MSCSVGCRHCSDLVLLWLWCRPAATALIGNPSLGTSICCRSGPRNSKKTKKNNNNKKNKEKKRDKGNTLKRTVVWRMLPDKSFGLYLDDIRKPLKVFFVFLLFLGPLLRHMEVPRLGVESEL